MTQFSLEMSVDYNTTILKHLRKICRLRHLHWPAFSWLILHRVANLLSSVISYRSVKWAALGKEPKHILGQVCNHCTCMSAPWTNISRRTLSYEKWCHIVWLSTLKGPSSTSNAGKFLWDYTASNPRSQYVSQPLPKEPQSKIHTFIYVIICPYGNPVDLEFKFLDSYPQDSEFSTPSDIHADWFARDWMPLMIKKKRVVGGYNVVLKTSKWWNLKSQRLYILEFINYCLLTLVVEGNHIQVHAGIFLFATTSWQAVGLRSLLSNGHYVIFPKG